MRFGAALVEDLAREGMRGARRSAAPLSPRTGPGRCGARSEANRALLSGRYGVRARARTGFDTAAPPCPLVLGSVALPPALAERLARRLRCREGVISHDDLC